MGLESWKRGPDQQGLVNFVGPLLLQSKLEHHFSRKVTQFDFKRLILDVLWKQTVREE